ncbi:MAG: RNA polymerase subunit sigma-70 [Bdellovibrio sp.]|nr:MAG: RNA polymerase subunit sigma-70 [Bdellovibrio sp.]
MTTDVNSWKELTKLTQGKAFDIERVRLRENSIAIEGRFESPPLARMTEENQVFVVAFLRSHGSIKEMERLFGISYPTVKARLTHIAEQLPFVETVDAPLPPNGDEVLDQLEQGTIDVDEAAELLRRRGGAKGTDLVRGEK